MIYFVKAESGHIKIGYSFKKTLKRLREIQTCNPFEMTVLKEIPGDKAMEKDIQSKFEKHRVRSEWFLADKDILDFIDNIDGYVPPSKSKNPDKTIGSHWNRLCDLIDKYGKDKTADMIGVTYRQLDRYLNGNTALPKPITKLVEYLYKDIK